MARDVDKLQGSGEAPAGPQGLRRPSGPSVTEARVAGPLSDLEKLPSWHDPEAAVMLERASEARPSRAATGLIGRMFGFEAVPAAWLLAGDVLAVGSLLVGCTVTAMAIGPAGLLVTVAMEAMAAAGGVLITDDPRPEPPEPPPERLPSQADTLEILADAFRQCRLKKLPLAVLLLGVDPLEEPREGWPDEEVLLQIAWRAVDALREEDALGRHGRDGLMVVVPGLGAAAAAMVAQRIRLAVAEEPLTLEGWDVPVTICVGVAATDVAPLADLPELVKRAAQALYRASSRRRNRVVVARMG